MVQLFVDYVLPFLLALAATAVLTPLVREVARRCGMVDEPGGRRVNSSPVPRGGGVALAVGVVASYAFARLAFGHPLFAGIDGARGVVLVALGFATLLLGLADDRFSLRPRTKLAGQLAIAALVRAAAGIGFGNLFPDIPVALDYALTVFWIVGAINAFNLIDGLDGLAAGLALIGTVGMGGMLLFTDQTPATAFHCAFAGGLIAFLFYNWNPASVFLGDAGSMFIGFTLAVMPLTMKSSDSFVVSVGVPLLAMGVPVFDTFLAIVRRTLRRHLGGGAAGEVMRADADHLHHRVLRAAGFNQRRAAWVLYLVAAAAVTVGFASAFLRDRVGGLWLVAVTAAGAVVFKSVARTELYDAGRLLNAAAHTRDVGLRRNFARLAVPLYVILDLLAVLAAFTFVHAVFGYDLGRQAFKTEFPIRVTMTFLALALLRTYVTAWSRAFLSNYARLFLASALGAAAGAAICYYACPCSTDRFLPETVLYWFSTGLLFMGIRLVRNIVRDAFYAIDTSRLVGRKDVSRVLVYGAGLRYRTFRRELVRRSSNRMRIVVGLLDDDITLKGHYIGGICVWGTLLDAAEVVNRLNADHVVVCCEISPKWGKVVRETLDPLGVKVTYFNFEETEVDENGV